MTGSSLKYFINTLANEQKKHINQYTGNRTQNITPIKLDIYLTYVKNAK
jgi:hypothetical protein